MPRTCAHLVHDDFIVLKLFPQLRAGIVPVVLGTSPDDDALPLGGGSLEKGALRGGRRVDKSQGDLEPTAAVCRRGVYPHGFHDGK